MLLISFWLILVSEQEVHDVVLSQKDLEFRNLDLSFIIMTQNVIALPKEILAVGFEEGMGMLLITG